MSVQTAQRQARERGGSGVALAALAGFPGPAERFWESYLEELRLLTGARAAAVLLRAGESGVPRCLLALPDGAGAGEMPARCAAEAWARGRLVVLPADEGGGEWAGFAMPAMAGRAQTALCLGFEEARSGSAGWRELVALLEIAAEIPSKYYGSRGSAAESHARVLETAFDVMAAVNEHARFLPAAMALCNELSHRMAASRVSLGWCAGGAVKVRAISGTDRVAARSEEVLRIGAAMDEAVDQGVEVMVPAEENERMLAITRAHRELAGSGRMAATWPVRDGGEVVGAVTVERRGGLPSAEELAVMATVTVLCGGRLAMLRRRSRSPAERFTEGLRDAGRALVRPEHTLAKIVVLAVIAGLLALALVPVDYRVEARFVLQSEAEARLPAPFDGYLERVRVMPGDAVTAGDLLFSLDAAELQLQEAAVAAEERRAQAEAAKAEAAEDLAALRIATASAEESRVRAELLRHQIQAAEVRAPFDGFVVEGDLRDRLRSPVRRGDVLLRLARTDALVTEFEIDEADIQDVASGAEAEIAFSSRPESRFPVRLASAVPVAVAKDGANLFLAKGRLACEPQDWWRPGMTGVAKIKAGRRSCLWILGHRTVDYLRMLLWF